MTDTRQARTVVQDGKGRQRDELAAALLPPGGATGQVPKKKSSADYDVDWEDESGGGGGSDIITASVSLSASQILNIHETPIQVIAAPGANKAIIIDSIFYKYNFGTTQYDSPSGEGALWYNNLSGIKVAIGASGTATFKNATSFVLDAVPGNLGGPTTLVGALANLPVIVSNSDSLIILGEITAATLNAGGSGYVPGDTGNDNNGNGDAVYVVDTVGGGGAVLTFHIDQANKGSGYAVATGDTTSRLSGSGTGFKMNVTAITPLGDGTAKLTVRYHIQDVS